ncbi:MAG TPA: 4Fe-4S binding protein, partial [Burkholderiaceae bacterium]|nr:4Fe-4S binding protein [Burkholderiaceae bacterium]
MLKIDDARCVHRLAARASCAACVRACPQGAWRSDVESLAFDAARCDGCGLCLGACPTGALALPDTGAGAEPLRQRLPDGGQAIALACARAPGIGAKGAADDPNVLPCVHAVDEDRLLRWQAAGVTRIALLTGDCPSCPRGRRLDAAQTLPGRLALLSALVPARSALPTVERLAAWAAAPA